MPSLATLRTGTAAAIVLLALGCGSDDTVAPQDPGAGAYWTLHLERSAITMALVAPYDTLQLAAIPRTPSGTPITTLGTVTYTTNNVDAVLVDSTGLLTAVGLTPGTQVIVRLTADGVTHADTATIAVTADPGAAIVASFSIHPIDGDSLRMALGGSLLEPNRHLTPIVLDPDDNAIFDLPVRYSSLDITKATIDPWSGTLTGTGLGYLPVVGAMTAYGRTFADTVQYRIQRPAYTKVHIHGPKYAYVNYQVGSFDPDSVTVGTGAVIEWEDAGRLPGTASNMIFDGLSDSLASAILDSVPEQFDCINYATDCDGTGNVPDFGPPLHDPTGEGFWQTYSRARRFTRPGVYRYTNTIDGTHGVVVVVDETAP